MRNTLLGERLTLTALHVTLACFYLFTPLRIFLFPPSPPCLCLCVEVPPLFSRRSRPHKSSGIWVGPADISSEKERSFIREGRERGKQRERGKKELQLHAPRAPPPENITAKAAATVSILLRLPSLSLPALALSLREGVRVYNFGLSLSLSTNTHTLHSPPAL